MLPEPFGFERMDFNRMRQRGRHGARGACPSLEAPMQTGDGWLVRLPPLKAPLAGAEVVTLCEAAERFGNGLLEITRRGNLQLRGLGEQSHRPLADYLDRHLPSHWLGVSVPAVTLDPLMEVDESIDDATRALARRLRAQVVTGAPPGLAPKSAVVIDTGGTGGPATLAGDLHVRLDGARGGWIGVAGDHQSATWLGWIVASRLGSAVAGLMGEMAALGAHARGADLLRDWSLYGLCDLLGCRPGGPPPRSGVCEGPDPEGRRQRHVLDVVWPFGRFEALALLRLVRRVTACGALSFAPAPGRHFRILCQEHARIDEIAAACDDAGMVVSPTDARLSMIACSGAPACQSGLMPTRTVAEALSLRWSSLFDTTVGLHLSGCAKGCASLSERTFTLVGEAHGVGLVFNGNPRGAARTVADDVAHLPGAFEHLARTLARRGAALPLSALDLERAGEETVVALLREGARL